MGGFEGGACGEGFAGLDATVELLQAGDQLGVLEFEHLDVPVWFVRWGLVY